MNDLMAFGSVPFPIFDDIGTRWSLLYPSIIPGFTSQNSDPRAKCHGLKRSVTASVFALAGTKVTDTGLVHLKDCQNLKELSFQDVPVSDAGLAHLKECKNLTQLFLGFTRVTAKGIAELKTALPKCKIEQ